MPSCKQEAGVDMKALDSNWYMDMQCQNFKQWFNLRQQNANLLLFKKIFLFTTFLLKVSTSKPVLPSACQKSQPTQYSTCSSFVYLWKSRSLPYFLWRTVSLLVYLIFQANFSRIFSMDQLKHLFSWQVSFPFLGCMFPWLSVFITFPTL